MSEELFDRYRDALRAGHVAVRRGQLEEAAAAYRDAAGLAADRAVPRSALGSVELRLGQPEMALASFDEALSISPLDDAALHGRAQALVVLERPDDAASTFDLLVEARRDAGKLADACDALRRALEIQPTAARRQRYRELTEEVRKAIGEAEAERALARAGRYLEPETIVPIEAEAPSRPATAVELSAVNPEPAPIVDGDALLLAAEEAALRGDTAGAVAAAMAAGRAFRAAGHAVAALDACVSGLRSGPDDVDLHLLIAELAFERGAIASAADTYRGLLHLVDVGGDEAGRLRVLAAARAAFPDDPRFAQG